MDVHGWHGQLHQRERTVSDVIVKATATIAVTPYSVNYNGAPQTAAGSATGTLGENLAGLDISGTTHTNAGTYSSDAWTFTDATATTPTRRPR